MAFKKIYYFIFSYNGYFLFYHIFKKIAVHDLLTWLHDQNLVGLRFMSWFGYFRVWTVSLWTVAYLPWTWVSSSTSGEDVVRIKWDKLYKALHIVPGEWKNLYYKHDFPLIRLFYIEYNWLEVFTTLLRNLLESWIKLYSCPSAVWKPIHKCFVKE